MENNENSTWLPPEDQPDDILPAEQEPSADIDLEVPLEQLLLMVLIACQRYLMRICHLKILIVLASIGSVDMH